MNPLTILPANVRRVVYVVYAALGPVLTWTQAKGWTGEAEITLWVGLGTALGLVAAANTVNPTAVEDHDSPTGEVAGEASDIPTGTPVETTPLDDPSKPFTGWGHGI
jgi:hypothetical protein